MLKKYDNTRTTKVKITYTNSDDLKTRVKENFFWKGTYGEVHERERYYPR